MTPSRRELLASFLGLPFALSACQSSPRRVLAGEIVGASVDAGHKIKAGERLEPASDAWRDVDVVILGGGVAGLSAAWRLLSAGLRHSDTPHSDAPRFELLELEPEVGGTARSGRNRVSAYP